MLSAETIDGINDSILRDVEAAQVLERAAYRVERGWTHGVEAQFGNSMVDYWSPDAGRFCMRGGIQRALLDLGHTKLDIDEDGERVVMDGTVDASSVRARAFGAAAHVILGQVPDPMSNLPRIVSHWNDNTAVNGRRAGQMLRRGARHIRKRVENVKRGLKEGR
jgi:hypothetical protein